MSYKCKKCNKSFYDKSHLKDHLNRKFPCINDKKTNKNKQSNEIYCEKCDKYFSRPYTLKRHMESKHKNEAIIANINNKNGKITQIVHNGDNHNNIVIKNLQYNLFPFGKDGIDCLTLLDKIAIFSSNEDPFVMIVIKVNLDPDKLDHHNVGYIDNHCGYGFIYDGDKWISERISIIMEVLFKSKEKDLLEIYDEIEHFLTDDAKNNIDDSLSDFKKIIRPSSSIDFKAKKFLIAHLKKYLFNNKNLALNAMKYTNKSFDTNPIQNQISNIFKEGYTIENVEQEIHKIYLKKNLAKYLLNELNIKTDVYNSILKVINKTKDLGTINIIIKLLIESFCSNAKINEKIIKNTIENIHESNKLVDELIPKL